jgi:hypothetical protein
LSNAIHDAKIKILGKKNEGKMMISGQFSMVIEETMLATSLQRMLL